MSEDRPDCDDCGNPVASVGVPLSPQTTVCHLCWCRLGRVGGETSE